MDMSSSSPSATVWLELEDDLGINVGQDSIGTNAERGVDQSPSHDVEAFDLVGKIGLGDMEISDDETTLFVMNILDKTVYAIDIATKTLSGTFPLPDPMCVGGEFRPWALSFHEGELYAGGLCDGSLSGDDPMNYNDVSARQDLEAFVYRLDGSTFTEVLNFDLDYLREGTFGYADPCLSLIHI